MAATKPRVLAVLRELYRVRREVFQGDSHALEVTKQRIREEFRKNALETDPTKIEEALVVASDVAKLFRTSVVQLKQKDGHTFELRLRKSIVLPENIPFDLTKEIPINPRRKKRSDNSESSDVS